MPETRIPLESPVVEELELLRRESGHTLAELVAELVDEALAARRSNAAGEADAEIARHHKTRFLSGLVHELRTPLGSVLILAELLAENDTGEVPDREVEHARKIHQATSEVLALIADVGLLNRIEAGRVTLLRSEVSLPRLARHIEESFRPVAEEKGLAFDVELAPDLPATVWTDRQQLERALGELVATALRVTEKGRVTIRFERRETFAGEEAEAIVFSVHDTGPPVSEEERRTLFEPFAHTGPRNSRRAGGTGLELVVARALAGMLGGEVSVRDGGNGFTVRLTLPAAPAPDAPPAG